MFLEVGKVRGSTSVPLISCLTVSCPARLDCLRSAVEDFINQTHPEKELVIVVNERDCAAVLDNYSNSSLNIRLVRVPEGMTLGALRNLAAKEATGDVLCQWDDDDRYSPERLSLQLQRLESESTYACFLHQQLHFFSDTRELFWTDWRRYDGQLLIESWRHYIPGTVMYRRIDAGYPEEGQYAWKGEDTVFAQHLLRRGAVGVVSPPGTYVRIFHGANAWDRIHHWQIAVHRSQTVATLNLSRDIIENSLFRFGISPPVKVMARDGVAFEYR